MADVSSNAIQPWIDRVQISAVIEEWPFWRENPNWEKLRKGTRGEGSPATVSCARHQRHRSERRIKARTGIYDWDRLDPVLPGARLEIDSERLARYPRSYRYLSYFNECNGVSQNLNLPVPGSEGEAVSAL